MKFIEKRKTTILNSNHYFNNGTAIRCDNDELYDKRYGNPYSGKYFLHYALRITR